MVLGTTCSKSGALTGTFVAVFRRVGVSMRTRRSKTQLLTLYFLDSGAYYNPTWDWFGILRATDYDYLRQDQIDWFLQESCMLYSNSWGLSGSSLVPSIDRRD